MAFIAGVMPAGAQKKVSMNGSTELMGDENKTISVAKDSKGYMTLFDGKTCTGWRGYGKGHVPARWTIENGCLKFNAGQGEGGDIIFAHKFKNFVLEMTGRCLKAPTQVSSILGRRLRAPRDMLSRSLSQLPSVRCSTTRITLMPSWALTATASHHLSMT